MTFSSHSLGWTPLFSPCPTPEPGPCIHPHCSADSNQLCAVLLLPILTQNHFGVWALLACSHIHGSQGKSSCRLSLWILWKHNWSIWSAAWKGSMTLWAFLMQPSRVITHQSWLSPPSLSITDAWRDTDSVQLQLLKLEMCMCLVVCCIRGACTCRLLELCIIDPVLKWKKTHLTHRVNGNSQPLWGLHLDKFS